MGTLGRREMLSLFALCLAASAVSAQNVAQFDKAFASSAYSIENFGAARAANRGSGYWCSAGSHDAAKSVTWTGVLNVRRKAVGVKINWAYGPGQVKVLVSSDGGNFEEAVCWRSSSRADVSYEETIMFDSPSMVKSLTISMKAPLSWGYFGINDVTLLSSGDENFMLVNGRTSGDSERCLVASGSTLGVAGCLDAVAAGDGREVFSLSGERLVHVASGLCASPLNAESKTVSFHDCASAARIDDGRFSWQLNSNGQLTSRGSGASCLVVVGNEVVLNDCDDATRTPDASDKFSLVAVPELNLDSARAARMGAELLSAAVDRQRHALSHLETLLPSLATCKFGAFVRQNATATLKTSLALNGRGAHASSAVRKNLGQDLAVLAMGKVYENIGADVRGSLQLIRDSAALIASAETKMARSA